MYLKNSSFDEASVMSRVCLVDHKIDQKFKPKVQKMSRLEQDEPWTRWLVDWYTLIFVCQAIYCTTLFLIMGPFSSPTWVSQIVIDLSSNQFFAGSDISRFAGSGLYDIPVVSCSLYTIATPADIYLEPIFSQKTPPKQGRNSNQIKGHSGKSIIRSAYYSGFNKSDWSVSPWAVLVYSTSNRKSE